MNQVLNGFTGLTLDVDLSNIATIRNTNNTTGALSINNQYYWAEMSNLDLSNLDITIDPASTFVLFVVIWDAMGKPSLPLHGNTIDITSNTFSTTYTIDNPNPEEHFLIIPEFDAGFLFEQLKTINTYLIIDIFFKSGTQWTNTNNIILNNITISTELTNYLGAININTELPSTISGLQISTESNNVLNSITIDGKTLSNTVIVNDGILNKNYSINSKVFSSNTITYIPNKFDQYTNTPITVTSNTANMLQVLNVPYVSPINDLIGTFIYNFRGVSISKPVVQLDYDLTVGTSSANNSFLSDTKSFAIKLFEPNIWLNFFKYTYEPVGATSSSRTTPVEFWTFEVMGNATPPFRWLTLNKGQIESVSIISPGLFSVTDIDKSPTSDPGLWYLKPNGVNPRVEQGLNTSAELEIILDTGLSFTIINGGSGYTYASIEIIGGGGIDCTVELDINSSIDGITIVSPGRRYQYKPYIKIIGDGVGAIIEADLIHFVSSVKILSPGDGYTIGCTIDYTFPTTSPNLIINIIDNLSPMSKLLQDLDTYYYCTNRIQNNDITFIGNFNDVNFVVDESIIYTLFTSPGLSQHLIPNITGENIPVNSIFGKTNDETQLADYLVIRDANNFTYIINLN